MQKESQEELSPCESQDSSSIISSNETTSDQNDFSFELSDRNYRYVYSLIWIFALQFGCYDGKDDGNYYSLWFRYYDSGTPCSSLSPSSSCLQSPCSSSFTVDSPQPTTADFCEFLQASSSGFERDFSNLTLSGIF